MYGSIVEIAREGVVIGRNHNSLSIRETDGDEHSVPMDMIDAVVLTARQATVTRSVMSELSRQGVPVIICDDRFMPSAIVLPFAVNERTGSRIEAQFSASVPLKKRLWQGIIRKKLHNQATVADHYNAGSHAACLLDELYRMADRVRPGDALNAEGQGARLYWRALFGPEFLRDQLEPGRNAMLNYAYAVLRSAVARHLTAAGLLPSLGLFHSNRTNPFALADDVMEPLRPFADIIVRETCPDGPDPVELTPEVKRSLAFVLNLPAGSGGRNTTLGNAIPAYAISLAYAYTMRNTMLDYPELLPETFAAAERQTH